MDLVCHHVINTWITETALAEYSRWRFTMQDGLPYLMLTHGVCLQEYAEGLVGLLESHEKPPATNKA